jgi:iron complex outermembrane recepter protein
LQITINAQILRRNRKPHTAHLNGLSAPYNMILKIPGMRSAFAATVAISSSIVAYAQAPATSPTTPRPAAAPAADDETIMMSPFVISEEPNRGYVSSESMTGSRVAVKIIDLPYTVNVLTSEFFEDFGIFELGDNVTQIGGLTGLDIGGSFNLRGFTSSSQLRDGFYRLGRYGSSNIDRMEIIKGSSAAIYGRTSPGGMVNMISKQPKGKESQKLTLLYGDQKHVRGTLETTGPVYKGDLGSTSYILTLSQFSRGFDQLGEDYARNRNNEGYLAIKHTFPDGSNLLVSAEYFLQISNSPQTAAPVVIDQKGTATQDDDVAIGYAKPLAYYNAFGPNGELNRGNISFGAVYDKRLNSIFSTRMGANYYRARNWSFNNNTGWGTVNINQPSGAIPSSARGLTPSLGRIYEDGGGFQGDLLARYKIFNGSVENQTLATVDVNDYYRYDPSWDYAQRGGSGNAAVVNGVTTFRTDPVLLAWNNQNAVQLNPDYTPRSQINYFPERFQWGKEYITRQTRRRATSYGGVFRHQSGFFDSSLLTFAGFRYDKVRFRFRDFTTQTANFPAIADYKKGQMIDRTVNELKPNVGANYKLTSNLRAFVNYSESYFVNQTDNADVIAAANYKSETADGWDYGLKGDFFDGNLTFTVSGFYINRQNVRVNSLVDTNEGIPNAAPNYVIQTIPEGDQLVRGAELDVTWKVSDEWSTGLSYGHVHSIVTDFGKARPDAVGRSPSGVSPHNGNVYVKWAPLSGALKNFSINLGVTHVSKTPSEAPDAGTTYLVTASTGNVTVLRSTRQWALKVPAYTLVDLGARYTLKEVWGVDHTIALNLKNITDEEYLRVNRRAGESFGAYFTYTITHF